MVCCCIKSLTQLDWDILTLALWNQLRLLDALIFQKSWHHCRIVSIGNAYKGIREWFRWPARSHIGQTGIIASIYDFLLV